MSCAARHGPERQGADTGRRQPGRLLQELQGHPAEIEALYKTGRKVAAVCALCHGEGGNSVRKESVMTPNARQMTDTDIAAVASYLSTMR